MDPTESKRQKMNDAAESSADKKDTTLGENPTVEQNLTPDGNSIVSPDTSVVENSEDNSLVDQSADGDLVTIKEHYEMKDYDNEIYNAVCGASDESECSYEKGYMGRQTVYSCADCCDLENNPAGFCHACALNCHSDCNIFELWTKRNFRCDCGNKKFKVECKLDKYKDDLNPKNKYNHNFKGLYCTCLRPYPCDEIESEMIQCVVCEDWLHCACIGQNQPPEGVNYQFICPKCTGKLNFLVRYKPLVFVGNVAVDLDNVEKNRFFCGVMKCDGDKPDEKDCKNGDSGNCVSTVCDPKSPAEALSKSSDVNCQAPPINENKNGEKPDTLSDAVSKDSAHLEKQENSSEVTSKDAPCDKSEALPNPNSFNGGSFWPYGWRQYLCKCGKCQEIYKKLDVSFITSQEDTVQFYEDRGQEMAEQREQRREMNVGSLPRTGQNALADACVELKRIMARELQRLVERGERNVTEADVKDIFRNFRQEDQ